MERVSRALLVMACGALLGCVPRLDDIPCASDEGCPTGQPYCVDGVCALDRTPRGTDGGLRLDGRDGGGGGPATDSAVVLIGPHGTTADSRPTLRWEPSWRTGATYDVQIATDSTFATLVEHAEGLTTTSYPMTSSLAQDETVSWRVAAVDQHGIEWSGPASLALDLGSVDQLLPPAGALTNDTTPTFSWSPSAHASTYTLHYGTAEDLSGATAVVGLTGTSYTVATPLPSTAQATYYWAVTPVDANGVAGRRSVRSFSLSTQRPTGTVTINQGAASTHVEVVTLTLEATGQGGITHMYVSPNGSFGDGSWVPFQTSSTLDRLDLSTTSSATITAHVKFRDALGNVSDEAKDTIELKRTLVSGDVATATRWTAAASPYYVTSTSTFGVSAPLTIEAGAEVYFKLGTKLVLKGGISAVGTPSSSIQLHNASLWLDYARTWVPANKPLTYNPDGSYATGPRFEHVLMPDGEIFVVTVDFDAPGFYMRQSTLGKVTPDFFGYVAGTYIDHSRIGAMGSADQDIDLEDGKVLNSYITSLWMNGYEWTFEISGCQIDSLSIDRWQSTTSRLERNVIRHLTWYRPMESGTATLHNNNIESTATELFRLGSKSKVAGVVNATGNYWGPAATAQMTSGHSNVTAIFDSFDDSTLDRVDFSGFLTTPVPDAGPNW